MGAMLIDCQTDSYWKKTMNRVAQYLNIILYITKDQYIPHFRMLAVYKYLQMIQSFIYIKTFTHSCHT